MKTQKFTRFLITSLIFMMIVSGALVGAAAPAPLKASENPAFANYLPNAQILSSITQKGLGYRPSPISMAHLTSTTMSISATLPASYDLRTLGKVSTVKDQGSAGSCWSFATYGSMESCLLTAESWDFSENNLKNKHGFDIPHDAGGNAYMSAAYLARWSGPVTESTDPYNPGSGISPSGLAAVKHVQNIVFLPLRTSSTDNSIIKQALMDNGAVYTSMYWADSSYTATTRAYCYKGNSSSNHAVTIVGWDDNYSKSNFAKAPTGNGAFIVKNSWGTSWGLSGYFYVSYYDTKFGRDENAQFVAPEATSNYSRIYQYDPLGWASSLGYSSATAWMANVFTAGGSESLRAASIYTASTGNTYELRIYTGVIGAPNTGTLAYTQTGTISNAGYSTIPLTTPVQLTAGQKFAVVFKLTTPNYTYPIPFETPLSGYSSTATASSGQSYISSNGTSWTDLTSSYANSNVCIKAFAN